MRASTAAVRSLRACSRRASDCERASAATPSPRTRKPRHAACSRATEAPACGAATALRFAGFASPASAAGRFLKPPVACTGGVSARAVSSLSGLLSRLAALVAVGICRVLVRLLRRAQAATGLEDAEKGEKKPTPQEVTGRPFQAADPLPRASVHRGLLPTPQRPPPEAPTPLGLAGLHKACAGEQPYYGRRAATAAAGQRQAFPHVLYKKVRPKKASVFGSP